MLFNPNNVAMSTPTQSLLQLLKLSSIMIRYKLKEQDGCDTFIKQSVSKGGNILNVGDATEDNLVLMRQVVGSSGKVIVFPANSLQESKVDEICSVMQWKNVAVSKLSLSRRDDEVILDLPFSMMRSAVGTTLGELKHILQQRRNSQLEKYTIDKYCLANDIEPSLIKINLPGDELPVLEGTMLMLEAYKPKVMVNCHEKNGGRNNILQVFSLLKHFGYTGSFLLDTIRIPLRNFDFNVYQNPRSDFYCSQFIFE
jgi:FkbM family methyltransferase